MLNLLKDKMLSLKTKLFRKSSAIRTEFLNEISYSELIILTGPPRSGTTWLNRELCNFPNTFNLLPECSLMTKQVELFNHILNYSDPKRFKAYFYNSENLQIFYRNNILKMLALVAQINKKQDSEILILKDPELSLYLDDVKTLFPTYKLIMLIRDPRDVLASMKNVMLRKQSPWDLERTSAQILLYYNKIAAYQKYRAKDALLVRYEDLVTNGLGEIQNFLQISSPEHVLEKDIVASISKNFPSQDPFFSQFYLQQTTKALIGSYKENLLKPEISYIEKNYSKIMRRWGY